MQNIQETENIVKKKIGDYGEALSKTLETSKKIYQSNLNELKKLMEKVENEVNDKTLLGMGKLVSKQYALVQLLKKFENEKKISNPAVKAKIKQLEFAIEKTLKEQTDTTILNMDGKSNAVQGKVMKHLDDLYRAAEHIVASDRPAHEILSAVTNIGNQIQATLGEVIANNQGFVDALSLIFSNFTILAETKFKDIGKLDRKLESIISANAKDYDDTWFPHKNTNMIKQNTNKHIEDMNKKVLEIINMLKKSDDDSSITSITSMSSEDDSSSDTTNFEPIDKQNDKDEDDGKDDKGGGSGSSGPIIINPDELTSSGENLKEAEEKLDEILKTLKRKKLSYEKKIYTREELLKPENKQILQSIFNDWDNKQQSKSNQKSNNTIMRR